MFVQLTPEEGAVVTRPEDQAPPGWRELCAKLQTEKDPVKFQAVVEEINRLLAAWEKKRPKEP